MNHTALQTDAHQVKESQFFLQITAPHHGGANQGHHSVALAADLLTNDDTELNTHGWAVAKMTTHTDAVAQCCPSCSFCFLLICFKVEEAGFFVVCFATPKTAAKCC